MPVTLTFIPEKLGALKIPFSFVIAGSNEHPSQGVILCDAIGPRIAVDCKDIRWGNIDCLIDEVRTLKIKNESLITAALKMFLRTPRSNFSLAVREMELQAGEEFELEVTANLDDTIVFRDELHIIVHEGENLMVPLSARGTGTAVFCSHDYTVIDFDVHLTNTTFEQKVQLENRGKRQAVLRWVNETAQQENESRAKKARALRTTNIPKKLLPMEPVFSVTPLEIVLKPRTAVAFVFKGYSKQAGAARETFVLESRVGSERSFEPVAKTQVRGEIIDPLIEFSLRDIVFEYSWVRDEKLTVLQKDLTLTNQGALPLSFILKTSVPFNLDFYEHFLQPGEQVSIILEFDPYYRDDRLSHEVEKGLTVVYKGHPQKDHLSLKGSIVFPNLKFDESVVQFGCILNDTEKRYKTRVTNCSQIDAAYEWTFMAVESPQKSKIASSKHGRTDGRPASNAIQVPPNQGIFTRVTIAFSPLFQSYSHPFSCPPQFSTCYRRDLC